MTDATTMPTLYIAGPHDRPARLQPTCQPSRGALVAEIRQYLTGADGDADSRTISDAVLALLPGRTEAEVKAEAWDEAVKATANVIWSDPSKPQWGWKHPRNPNRLAGGEQR